MSSAQFITLRCLIFLNEDGSHFFSRYYNSDCSEFCERLTKHEEQKAFEQSIFSHFTESFTDTSEASKEAEIFSFDGNVVQVKKYKDFYVFLVASEDENELIMMELLGCLHECLMQMASKGRELTLDQLSLDHCFPTFLSLIDELIDNGSIISQDFNEVYSNATMRQVVESPGEGNTVGSPGGVGGWFGGATAGKKFKGYFFGGNQS